MIRITIEVDPPTIQPAATWRQHVMNEIERLRAEVTENATVIASAVALVEGLARTIRENVGNTAELAQIADRLDAASASLAAAVVANTPAATPPPPPPPVGGEV